MTEISVARHHDPLRVARLLGVVGHRLESDPRPEGEEEADPGGQADARVGQLEHVQRFPLDAVGLAAAGAEDHDVEDREDDELADQGGAQHLHGELDVEPAQHADQERRAHCEQDPRDIPAEPRAEVRHGEVGEPAQQRDLEQGVGERARDAGREPQLTAEAVRDERVEAAGGANLARHRDIADREDREDDRREQERGRGVEAGAEAGGERHVEQHRGDGRSAGHRDEDHAHQADGPGLEAVDPRVRDQYRLDHPLVADLDPGWSGWVVDIGSPLSRSLDGRSCPTAFGIQPSATPAWQGLAVVPAPSKTCTAAPTTVGAAGVDRARTTIRARSAAEQVVRALERAAVGIPRGARDGEQRRAPAQPEQARLGGAGGDDLDPLLRLAGHQAVVRLEQLVQRPGERAVEQVGEPLGREAGALERDRLAVGEAYAHDLEHERRAASRPSAAAVSASASTSRSRARVRRTRSPGGAGRPAARRGW